MVNRKVFISYSHDSREHQNRVLLFANHLREWGIDATVDQFEPSPREGWPMWTERQVRQSDFVLVICTETYLRRVERREQPGRGRGVLWEAVLMYNELYARDAASDKFIPVLFEHVPETIPAPLRGVTYYQLALPSGFERLYRRLTSQPNDETLLKRYPALAERAARSYPSSPAAAYEVRPATGRELRNKLKLSNRVRQDWVRGVLEQSLDQGVRLELGLADRPTSVDRLLNAIVQVPDRPAALLRSDIAAVFADSSEALLILGAPGSGKTTLLLELARQLLDRFEIDPSISPVPVVFNLSSWALRRRPLARWLADELHLLYDIPRSLARRWVETEQILPLLDGLDEVAVSYREPCVEAINSFREGYGLLPIAVCSRMADYEALGRKLRLNHAIVVQPLTSAQVRAYFESIGTSATHLMSAVGDGSLQEFLQTPLMLSVAAVAFRDRPLSELPAGEPEQLQNALLSRFVHAMFRRRAPMAPDTEAHAIRWLTWLSRGWVRNGTTVFYLEYLGPRWLPGGELAGRLAVGAIAGLIFGLAFVLTVDAGDAIDSAVFFADEGALALLTETMERLAENARDALSSAEWVIVALIFGVVGGLVDARPVSAGFIGLRRRTHAALRPVWRIGLSVGLVGGLAVGLSEALGVGTRGGWEAFLQELFGVWLMAFPVLALLAGLVAGASKLFAVDPDETGSDPNRGASRSVVAALFTCLVIGPLFALFVELSMAVLDDGDVPDRSDLQTAALEGGLPIGLFAAAFMGGLFAVKHYACRAILWLSGKGPWRYARFLDSAADRLLLRKVGSGYIFVHRTVLEHFASRPESPPDSVAPRLIA